MRPEQDMCRGAAPDRPDAARDSSGQVPLALCERCGNGEWEEKS